MIDMISEMHPFEQVQTWFVQAVPALNRYIRLDPGFSANVRFKVLAPTNNLSIANTGNSVYYLGFDPATAATPRLNGQHTVREDFWQRVDMQETYVLFNPATYRSPLLQGFNDFAVGNAPYGSAYNSKFVSRAGRR